ncbi:MAG: MFS transporter [Rhizobiales bacterium]|nr:MFS transporter [Hyphomicrobiales bacterium]
MLITVGGLIQGSHAMLYSFGSLFWHAQGFGGLAIGAFWATAVIFEIALFMWSAPLVRRFGPFGFLALGGVAAIVRWLLFPLEPGLVGYLGLQALHAFSFGAVYLGCQHAVARTVPEELTASAQGVMAMMSGLMMALATLASGPLYEAFGGNAFALMAVMPAVALVILVLFRRAVRPAPRPA